MALDLDSINIGSTVEEKTLLNAIYERYGDIANLNGWHTYKLNYGPGYKRDGIEFKHNPETSESDVKIEVQDSNSISPRKKLITSVSVVMGGKGIEKIGDGNELEYVCQNVQELDLSCNELSDWNEIKKVMDSVKKLCLLNLSSNKKLANNNQVEIGKTLEFFRTEWSLLNSANYEKLNILILNSCLLDLKVVQALIEKIPNLSELHLSLNNYSEVTFDKDFVKNSIKVLYFNNNNLPYWNEVCKLGSSFPNLEHLSLSENTHIRELKEDNQSNIELFKSLHTVILNKLNIDNWNTIDQLKEMPTLKHVRIQNIPILNGLNEEERFFLVSSHLMETVETLNGSKISERDTLERKYMRYFMDRDEKPNRYYELEQKHGKLDPLADVKMKAANLIQVKIKFNDKHTYKKIDVKKTVADLKKSLESFAELPSSKFRLYYIDVEAVAVYGADELRIPTKKLYTLNVKDGDEFEIRFK